MDVENIEFVRPEISVIIMLTMMMSVMSVMADDEEYKQHSDITVARHQLSYRINSCSHLFVCVCVRVSSVISNYDVLLKL